MGRKVRIGIDVGGTFTKAVLIDNETYEILGKCAVLTTHTAPEGVAKGVIEVFHRCLSEFNVDPSDVVLLAHSTTQATNALLEGDVEPVGVIGMGTGFDGFRAKSCTKIGDIKLAPGRVLKVFHSFIDTGKDFSYEKIKLTVQALQKQGAKAIVASEAFGVDNPIHEQQVVQVCSDMGIPAIGANEISKLYGLTVRTRTAVINASILPKMLETANMTEASMRKAGINAPLMIMRGDGGVMDINEMRRRPILTILSGPAASVAGALFYLRVSDGIFFEVGGTSTNIGVIRNGRPMIKYVEIGGHPTYLHSLDVRVIGVAGGSMVRVRNNQIVDVGPRSAHIAGLPYAAFTDPAKIVDPKVVFIQPKPGDPSDYVAIKTKNGELIAITNTCAANALGLTKPGDYAYGNPEAARKAIEALAKEIGSTVEDVATKILEISSSKIIRIINELCEEYSLDKRSTVLVGGGGGAAALIPFTAKVLGMDYKISENAEVISSIGVALCMVKEMVERTVINPTPDDILRIRKEAEDAAIKAGALPGTVDVFVEVDTQRCRVRAIALGSTELRSRDLTRKATPEERKLEAARSMHVPIEQVKLSAQTDSFDIYTAKVKKGLLRGYTTLLRVVDKAGFVRLSLSNAEVFESLVHRSLDDLGELIQKYSAWLESGQAIPQIYCIIGGRIIDMSGLKDAKQVLSTLKLELQGKNPEDKILFIIKRVLQ
jgi:N-methylhydantoinase A/oxoprolinase/acetone carboxylase beta subunit